MTLYKINGCLYKHKGSYFYPLILYNLIILKKRFYVILLGNFKCTKT